MANEQLIRNAISTNELAVLGCLSTINNPSAEITEIVSGTGIRDSDEVLRALYTLEGKSLVSPFPEGDFTSNQWKITNFGLKALRLANQ